MKISAHSQRTRLTRASARPGRVVKPRQCRICLETETWDKRTEQSSLDRGICRDRAACESRQAPLW